MIGSELVLGVIGLFVIRIGLPIVLLLILEKVIHNWQKSQFEK